MGSKQDGDGVGYGRPPQQTRFKKGVSGNPQGRPKGAKNLATLLGQTLNERVVVNENGRKRSISKLQAAVKQLVNRAASGDPKFMHQLLGLVQLVEGRESALAPEIEPLTDSDRRVIEGVLRRLARPLGDKSQ